MSYWTDYPIVELGDAPGLEAPIRQCLPLSYDGNKYCRVNVGGVTVAFKAGYIYSKLGRCGDVPAIDNATLHALPHQYPA